MKTLRPLTWHRWACACGKVHPVLVYTRVTCICGRRAFVDETYPAATDDDFDRDEDWR